MNFFARLEKFHKTPTGYMVFAIIELALAFLFALAALASGSIIEWILAIILLIGVVQNFIKLAVRLVSERR